MRTAGVCTSELACKVTSETGLPRGAQSGASLIGMKTAVYKQVIAVE